MSFIFSGNLAAYLCDEQQVPLSAVVVRLYRRQGGAETAALAVAHPKETFAMRGDDAQKALEGELLAEANTDDAGNFTVTLDEKTYRGEAFDLDFRLESAPHPRGRHDAAPRQFFVTTVQPNWRQRENDYIARWEYVLPSRIWCAILEIFDIWVICGTVKQCQRPHRPVANVTVTAFDADWITDDRLGDATTDSNGQFCIYYTSADFKQTFLSPLINIETPFPPFNSGPDVYFRIEASDGTVLLQETRADGEQPARDNIGNCFCVELCVEVEVTPENEPVPSVWTNVGTAFVIPDSDSLNDFDADGYAGATRYALTSSVRLMGSAPRTQNGHPVEYRFLVSDATTPNGGPPPAIGNFTRVVGVSPNDGLFVPTEIGKLTRFLPFDILTVVARLVDLDANGWLDVNASIERTFNEAAIPAGDRPFYFWSDSDTLMALNTAGLTTEPDVPPNADDPGQPVPAGDLIAIEKCAIRFEVREVINKPLNQFVVLPASGTTLNAMIINNNPMYLKVAMQEHLLGSPCGILSGPIHAAYTVYHPHLLQANLHIRSNDNAINTNLTDGATGLPLAGNTNPAINHLNNPSLAINPPLVLHKCTYLVTLSATRRLHTGDGAVGTDIDQTTFFFNV